MRLKRGELYRVRHPKGDPKKSRVFVVVSRDALLESRYATAICAPVHTTRSGLETQIDVGTEVGLKHDSSIHCDSLVSVPKELLTDFVGRLSSEHEIRLDQALRVALAIESRRD
jgi:mRNA interferase MazF